MIPCECKPNFEKPVNYSIPAFLISPSWHALNSKLPLCLLWWVTDDGSPSSNPSLKYLTKLINMFTHYAVKDNEGHGSDHVTWEPPQSRWSYRSRSASKPHPLFHRVSLVCVTQVLVSNISAMCCCKGHTLWSKYGGGASKLQKWLLCLTMKLTIVWCRGWSGAGVFHTWIWDSIVSYSIPSSYKKKSLND